MDTHGQSEVAFACCRLLGFQLLPRLKAITHINPYSTFELDMNRRLPIEPQRQGPGQETLQLPLMSKLADGGIEPISVK